MNRVILIGRLTRDCELRYTPSGVATAQFNLAVDRGFKNDAGEREADFISVVTWRQLAENVANYTRKGRLVAVEGRWQTRHYDNNEGKRVYVNECVADKVSFLERADSQPSERQEQRSNRDPFVDDGKPIEIADDDLPF